MNFFKFFTELTNFKLGLGLPSLQSVLEVGSAESGDSLDCLSLCEVAKAQEARAWGTFDLLLAAHFQSPG